MAATADRVVVVGRIFGGIICIVWFVSCLEVNNNK